MSDNGISNFHHHSILPNRPLNRPVPRNQAQTPSTNPNGSFQDVFRQTLNNEKLHFSQHAKSRLNERGISLNPDMMSKLNDAVEKAAGKGAKDALIVMKDLAMIVNVKNRTVVTAVDGQSMKENVFTQIDSAVILP